MSLPIPESAGSDAAPADRLADLSPAPLVLVDGRIIRYANPAFSALCGVPVADLVGLAFSDIVHEHDRSHVQERLSEHQAGRNDTYRAQFRLCPIGGGDGRWVYATLAAVRVGGRPATLATALDATERRGVQDAVSRTQRLDAIARLAGGLAHRLNNTLQIVVGHAEKIAAALPSDHPAAASGREVRRAADRAATLTDQLLSLGQRQVLDPKAVDVGRLLSELKAPIEQRVGPSIDLVIRRGTPPAVAWVDGARLVHVVAALVDRAREVMPSGGELVIETSLVTVDRSARRERPWLREGEFVRLVVGDSSAEQAADATPRLFEPFVGTHATRDELAIASAYGLIKQSQGFVWLESNPSGGTSMVVLLPSVAVPAREDAADDTPSREPAPVAPLEVVPSSPSPTRVLVVEDEPSVRELLAEGLERNGFAVQAVGSAEEALPHVGTFDVLLSDISLPGRTGVELARLVRHRQPAAKVLLMSGYAREEFLTPADDLPFIGKPFTNKAIVERLRALTSSEPPGLSQSRPA